ncbi:MAG: T9SS type A sorting domain-containing protein [Saprospiraceae bacterium]|nr:T9SS type A sorting domain-containing protein [Saprospiraceae bacterium]
MKKSFILLAILSLTNLLSAQVEVELTIENQQVVGTDFFFDVYLRRTATNPGAGDLYLGNADFVLTYNNGNFTNPVLTQDPDFSPGDCTFVPTNTSGLNTLFTQDQYFTNTALMLSGNEIRINLNGPTPGTQSNFDTRVARINQTASTHRLGGYKISGISNPTGTAGLEWKTTGTIVTQVFTLANTSPWASSAAEIVATNPSDFALPVQLNAFAAVAEGEKINLRWQSTSETNFSGYELQRSTNARDFTKIAWVFGKGGGGYEHTDADVRPGTTYYYRLKMLDLNGSFELSRVRSAKIEAAAVKDLQISPNPAFGYFKVNFETSQAGDATLEMINELGQVVMSKRYQFTEGSNSIMVNSVSFPAGNYWLKIHDADGTQTGKLVIGKR